MVLAVLMMGNSVALGGIGLLIARDRLIWWLIATGLLVVNALLSVADETGIFDWLTLAGSVVVLGLVLAAWISGREPEVDTSAACAARWADLRGWC